MSGSKLTRSFFSKLFLMSLVVGWTFSHPAWSQQDTDLKAEAERRLEQQRTLNDALEKRIRELEAQLDGDVCSALDTTGVDGCIVPTTLIDFTQPLGSERSSAEPPLNTQTETAAGNTESLGPPRRASSLQLLEILESGSGFILTVTGSSGSGFFIAPGLMLTNNHVVKGIGADAKGAIFVTSRHLGQVYEARIVASAEGKEMGGADFALLKLMGQPQKYSVLKLSAKYNKLDEVLAAGYPGIVVANDRALKDLLKGNESAAPDLVVNQGHISALQQAEDNGTVVVHTADIASGNSGGPLIDACGRVIGINTFITANQESASRAGFALGSDKILAFLNAAGLSVQKSTESCPAG